jgi:DnaJ-class molecular chaperone
MKLDTNGLPQPGRTRARICRNCNGTGVGARLADGTYMPCSRCHGSGFAPKGENEEDAGNDSGDG